MSAHDDGTGNIYFGNERESTPGVMSIKNLEAAYHILRDEAAEYNDWAAIEDLILGQAIKAADARMTMFPGNMPVARIIAETFDIPWQMLGKVDVHGDQLVMDVEASIRLTLNSEHYLTPGTLCKLIFFKRGHDEIACEIEDAVLQQIDLRCEADKQIQTRYWLTAIASSHNIPINHLIDLKIQGGDLAILQCTSYVGTTHHLLYTEVDQVSLAYYPPNWQPQPQPTPKDPFKPAVGYPYMPPILPDTEEKIIPEVSGQPLHDVLYEEHTGATNGAYNIYYTDLGTYHIYETSYAGEKRLEVASDKNQLLEYSHEYNFDVEESVWNKIPY